ncbi:unnamed protein product, partial [Owenia fusiformis]
EESNLELNEESNQELSDDKEPHEQLNQESNEESNQATREDYNTGEDGVDAGPISQEVEDEETPMDTSSPMEVLDTERPEAVIEPTAEQDIEEDMEIGSVENDDASEPTTQQNEVTPQSMTSVVDEKTGKPEQPLLEPVGPPLQAVDDEGYDDVDNDTPIKPDETPTKTDEENEVETTNTEGEKTITPEADNQSEITSDNQETEKAEENKLLENTDIITENPEDNPTTCEKLTTESSDSKEEPNDVDNQDMDVKEESNEPTEEKDLTREQEDALLDECTKPNESQSASLSGTDRLAQAVTQAMDDITNLQSCHSDNSNNLTKTTKTIDDTIKPNETFADGNHEPSTDNISETNTSGNILGSMDEANPVVVKGEASEGEDNTDPDQDPQPSIDLGSSLDHRSSPTNTESSSVEVKKELLDLAEGISEETDQPEKPTEMDQSEPGKEDDQSEHSTKEINQPEPEKEVEKSGQTATKMDQSEPGKEKEKEAEMSLKISSVSGSTIQDANIPVPRSDPPRPADTPYPIPVETSTPSITPTSSIKLEPKEPEKEEKTLLTETVASNIKQEKLPEKPDIKPTIDTTPPAQTESQKKASKFHKCIVCSKVGKCKYNIVRNGDIKHLCDDKCFKVFRANPANYLQGTTEAPPASVPKEATSLSSATNPVVPQISARVTQCFFCTNKKMTSYIRWLDLDFCQEKCLSSCQMTIGDMCAFCGVTLQLNVRAKFCIWVADTIKQCCSVKCHSDYQSRTRICTFCNKIVSGSGLKKQVVTGQGKLIYGFFCNQQCWWKLDDTSWPNLGTDLKRQVNCAVCGKDCIASREIKINGKCSSLCSDPCLAAFRYANKLGNHLCAMCGAYCFNEGMLPQLIRLEGEEKRLCSFRCSKQFKNVNAKPCHCAWCNNIKINTDMIEKIDENQKVTMFCTLNCLSLFRVNQNAASNKHISCDKCSAVAPAQYHLTMSDASVRNFCSYNCVMQFQKTFSQPQPPATTKAVVSIIPPTTTPMVTQTTSTIATNTTPGTRTSKRLQKQPAIASTQQNSMPLISNVVSLAAEDAPTKAPASKIIIKKPITVPQIQQTVVVQPPPPKQVKNKSLLCKPFTMTKATSCRPHTQTKEAQTVEDINPKLLVIPVPVPIYVPVPMAMYNHPVPFPLPIPIPVPVPQFIPTSKKNADSILKHVKEIQERMPADPFEAEILMMAEAVATEGKADSDSDTEVDEPTPAPPIKEASTFQDTNSPTVAAAVNTNEQTSNTALLSEDMLQMALRMTEMTEPMMDLETTLEPASINPEAEQPAYTNIPAPVQQPEIIAPPSPPKKPTRKRGGPGRGRGRGKRQRVSAPIEDRQEMIPQQQEVVQPQEPPPPPPDADMRLKYTYGVNAWKHWVLQKNAQLERASKSSRVKMFKTDILGCTADELNYSLCLFVKEVRKPNGEEYAPDSIYYLCLGIQQYLYESGRIDNLFADFYYEKFAESLNEIVSRYEVKLNHQGLIVCRIEEDHLWECKQLGAHSPHVLLNTLVYFNTKSFLLKTPEEHLKLSFSHIMKHMKKTNMPGGKTPGRMVYLRYYAPLANGRPTNPGADKKRMVKEDQPVFEQCENADNPLRCPVKLYEFYLSKCPESIKNRNDVFYLTPERSCVPDSPVWYSTIP